MNMLLDDVCHHHQDAVYMKHKVTHECPQAYKEELLLTLLLPSLVLKPHLRSGERDFGQIALELTAAQLLYQIHKAGLCCHFSSSFKLSDLYKFYVIAS